jgi:hypothetical protein
MTYEKHKLTTDALDTLGSIIGPDEKRDAIHLAVDPVEAGERLRPAEHVTLVGGKAWLAGPGHGIGIVDPFLEENVARGERFWLVVYPRQITSLRHVWEHPALDEPLKKDDPDQSHIPDQSNASHAETWLRDWLGESELSHVPLEGIVQAVETGNWGDPTSDYSGLNFDSEFGFTSIGIDAYGRVPDEFWAHLADYLGHEVPHLTTNSNRIGCTC